MTIRICIKFANINAMFLATFSEPILVSLSEQRNVKRHQLTDLNVPFSQKNLLSFSLLCMTQVYLLMHHFLSFSKFDSDVNPEVKNNETPTKSRSYVQKLK